MTLIFEDEIEQELPFDPEALALTVAEKTLDMLTCPYEVQVSLLLTGDEQIREMNRNFRSIDRETDVLSFPMNDFEKPGDFSFLEADEENAESFDPDSGELVLGDIVINVNRVFSQAQEYGHSPKREFAFLTAHSMLHLCGFDHMSQEEASDMEKRQEEVLGALGIYRS